MELLHDKYLPAEDVKNIALKASPRKLVPFCYVSKVTVNICNDINFWKSYIGDDQKKYNKLILEIAKYGDIKLLQKVWINDNLNVIVEPKIFLPAFENAYLNGHKILSSYFIYLYNQFETLTISLRSLTDITVKNIYSIIKYHDNNYWRYIHENFWYNTKYFIQLLRKIIDNHEFKLMLKIAVLDEDFETTIALIKKYRLDNFSMLSLLDALAYSPSSKFLNKVLYAANIELSFILKSAIYLGNFILAQEIIDEYPKLKQTIDLRSALTSDSPYSINFIKNNEKGNLISNMHNYLIFDGRVVGNRKVLYKILGMIDNNDQSYVILNSPYAFRNHPHEYINLIMEYLGCISKGERNNVLISLFKNGEYYAANIFNEEIVICDT